MSKKLIYLLITIIFVTLPSSTFANHRQEVLGDAAEVEMTPEMPATSEGPGFIQPDSPFYFLDKFKQQVRLFVAFSPEQKAKVYQSVAGERLAELRFMLEKENEKGTERALEGFAENINAAAEQVEKAQFQGKDVTQLSRDMNNDIELKKIALEHLEETSSGELLERVKFTKASLREAKIKVEDTLPEGELEVEIAEMVREDVGKELKAIDESSRKLEKNLEFMNKKASEEAKNNQLKRELELQKLREQKDVLPRKEQEKLIEKERIRQELKQKEQQKALEKAKKAAAEAKAAAETFKESDNEVFEETPVKITPEASDSAEN